MAKRKANRESETRTVRRRPALTPDARENQLIALAYDAAERRIIEGTASSQEIVHFLKLGSSRGRLEKAKLERETALLEAKKETLESAQRMEEIYQNALNAMKSYSPTGDTDDPDVQ